METKDVEFRYVGDTPISDPEQDEFLRWPFAARIAETIAHRKDATGLVIGVYGAWGEGKTTVINFIRHRLRTFDDVVEVNFNPWRFGSEDQLILAFFETIAGSLKRKLKTDGQEFGELLKKYSQALAPVGASGVASALGEALSRADLEEHKAKIEEILAEEGKRLVVFMDDIDRLDKSEIHAVFRLVKLSADFCNTTYVLAFDETMVAAALSERYASADAESGSSFLEKIIQVPLSLPPASQSALDTMCLNGLDEALKMAKVDLEEEAVSEYQRTFFESISPVLKTPRLVKRYVNAVLFSLPMVRGEVYVTDFLLSEALRVFYPKLYEFIHANRERYLCREHTSYSRYGDDKKEQDAQARHGALEMLREEEQAPAAALVKVLFPRTDGSIYDGEWEQSWATGQRIASGSYFDRYFVYSVPLADISDKELRLFVEALADKEEDALEAELLVLLKNRESAAIRKLRWIEENLEETASRKLALCLAKIGGSLPNSEGPLTLASTPYSQAAILGAHLLRNLEASKRADVARTMIHLATPLPFAAELFTWMRSKEDISPEDRLLTEGEELEMFTSLAEKIEGAASERPLYKQYPKESPYLLSLWSWGGSTEATKAYIEAQVKGKPAEVREFLMTYSRTGWSLNTGISHRIDLDQDSYNSIAAVANTDMLYETLETEIGANVVKEEFPKLYGDEEDTLQTVAKQFMYLHLTTSKQSAEDAEKSKDS